MRDHHFRQFLHNLYESQKTDPGMGGPGDRSWFGNGYEKQSASDTKVSCHLNLYFWLVWCETDKKPSASGSFAHGPYYYTYAPRHGPPAGKSWIHPGIPRNCGSEKEDLIN